MRNHSCQKVKRCATVAPVLGAVLTAFVLGCPGARRPAAQQSPGAKEAGPTALAEPVLGKADPGVAPGLRVAVGCNEADLRMVVADVSWRGDAKQTAAERVDFTPFKDGFERGVFATAPAGREGKFERVGTGKDRGAGRPLELLSVPRKGDSKELVGLEVRNLEPGVLYTIRVVRRTEKGLVPSTVVRVLAPVCVADEKEGR